MTETAVPIRHKQIPNLVLLNEVERLIADGHSVTLTIRGDSMNPFLVDGRDQVVLSPFKDKDIVPGAVVLAREEGGRILLHRIISRQNHRLILQGDGNIGYTEQTTISDVLGLLTKIIRKGKYYSCNEGFWIWYSQLWTFCRPLRRELLRMIRFINRHRQ